ncbi:MAG TPA: DUF5985 family protein [Polyangiaceae bacterium]|jgi:hypothetical protein
MAELVYALCALASLFCAALLIRNYRSSRSRFALWTSVSFVGLALNNVLLFIDLIIVPEVDLSVLRTGIALLAVMTLIVGLIWEGI